MKRVNKITLLFAGAIFISGFFIIYKTAVAQKSHPRLKDTQESTCLKCHKSIKAPFGLHEALNISDCSSCHKIEIEETVTRITLKDTAKGVCLECHEDIASRLEKEIPHTAMEDKKSCLVCHKPHWSSNPKLLAKPEREMCAECHKDQAGAIELAYPHAPISEGCSLCHNAHSSASKALVKKAVSSLCFDCHSPKDKAYLAKHLNMDMSKSTCVPCHAPHGSNARGMLAGKVIHPPFASGDCETCHSGKEMPQATASLCGICHNDIAKAVESDVSHPPAMDNCSTCHNPHASENKALLNAPQKELCADCHDINEPAMLSAHGKIKPSMCSTCHEPHGSKNKRLLQGNFFHKPFAEKNCNACHYKVGQKEHLVLLFSTDKLCLRCHTGIEKALALPTRHKALDKGCAACHNPHMSNEKTLIRAEPFKLCGTCHALDAIAEKHNGVPLRNVDCLLCHTPHSSVKEKLLREGAEHPPFEARTCEGCHKEGKLVAEGTELCLLCHEKPGKGAKFLHSPVEENCLSCHEPHIGSAQGFLKDSLAKICFSCHSNSDENFKKAHGGWNIDNAICTKCHNPHGGDRKFFLAGGYEHSPFGTRSCETCHKGGESGKIALSESGNTLCLTCHEDIAQALKEPFIHSAIEKDKCVACHEPHIATYAKQLRKEGNYALCITCHKETIKGSTIHSAIESGGCSTCHLPHTSKNEFQLVEPQPALCILCHDIGGLNEQHKGQPIASAKCSRCHNPHSSDGKKLAKQVTHSPFAEGMCETCHLEAEGGKVRMAEEGNALCFLCHDDKKEQIASQNVHPVVETAGCSACHEPHSASYRSLLMSEEKKVCLSCHKDVLSGGPIMHGAIARWGCSLCHEPHAAASANLLRESVNSLCLECHLQPKAPITQKKEMPGGRISLEQDELKVIPKIYLRQNIDHPRPNHPVSGEFMLSFGKKEKRKINLTCTSCHNPHSGADKTLFQNGLTQELDLCQVCHAV